MKITFDQRALFIVGGLAALLLLVVLLIPGAEEQEPVIRYVPDSLARAPIEQQALPAPEKQLKTKPEEKTVDSAPSADQVEQFFKSHGYSLASVREENKAVPKLYLVSMPRDLGDLLDIPLKKRLFFKTVLPLVLQTNEKILTERKRIWGLHYRQTLGERLGAVDRTWLKKIARKYKVKDGDTVELLNRIDIIPPSLALAQAAEESGWGTSRFVRHGNAMFGQWTFSSDHKGITPEGRDEGKSHRIRAFDSLLQSVEAYARNLNTHRAYRVLRGKRAQLRNRGQVIDGPTLAKTLNKYSERGQAYVDGLMSIINANELAPLDKAKLKGGNPITTTLVQAGTPVTADSKRKFS